jgi:hypothetical protein
MGYFLAESSGHTERGPSGCSTAVVINPDVSENLEKLDSVAKLLLRRGCQMVYFQTKNPTLVKF